MSAKEEVGSLSEAVADEDSEREDLSEDQETKESEDVSRAREEGETGRDRGGRPGGGRRAGAVVVSMMDFDPFWSHMELGLGRF